MRLSASKINALACAFVFLACMAVYLPTLNPIFRADDSPETVSAAVHLGIQHPPGYPLHTLVGHLFTRLPLANPAFRLNLMAALFAALACAGLAAMVFTLLHRHRQLSLKFGGNTLPALAAICGGLFLGFSKTFWTQALAAKGGIYTFHAFLIVCLSACLLAFELSSDPRIASLPARNWIWTHKPLSSFKRLFVWLLLNLRRLNNRWFYLFCLLAGLASGNHWETQKVVLVVSAFYLLSLFSQSRPDLSLPQGRFVFKPLLKALILFGLGFSIYLLLPLRAAMDPPMNWGNPTTWERFLWVFERQQYLDLETGFLKALSAWAFHGGPWSAVNSTWVFVARQGSRVFTNLILQPHLGYAGVVLALAGIIYTLRRRAWPTLTLWGGLGLVFASAITFYFHLKPEMIWIQDVFLIPAFMAQALFAALGAAWLLAVLQKKLGSQDARRWMAPFLAVALIFTGILSSQKLSSLVSQRQQFWAYDFARDFLDFTEKNSIILAEGDFNTMPIYYLQYVEGRRRDVSHLTTIFLSIDWGIEQLKRRYPQLGVSAMPKPRVNQRQGDGGLLLEAVRQIRSHALATGKALHASLFRQVLRANAAELEKGFYPHGLTVKYFPPGASSPLDFAHEKQRAGILRAMRSRFWKVDRDSLEDSPAFALSNYAAAWMELAVLRRGQGKLDEALYLFEVAARLATHPNLAQAYTHLGIGYNAKGDLKTAAKWFLKAAKEKPIFEAWSNLAGTYNQLKQYAQAENAARKAIAINSGAAQNWNNLGIALFYQKKKDQAVQALQKGLQLDPSNAQLQSNLRAIRASP